MDIEYHECRHKDAVIYHPVSEDCDKVYKVLKLIPLYQWDESKREWVRQEQDID